MTNLIKIIHKEITKEIIIQELEKIGWRAGSMGVTDLKVLYNSKNKSSEIILNENALQIGEYLGFCCCFLYKDLQMYMLEDYNDKDPSKATIGLSIKDVNEDNPPVFIQFYPDWSKNK